MSGEKGEQEGCAALWSVGRQGPSQAQGGIAKPLAPADSAAAPTTPLISLHSVTRSLTVSHEMTALWPDHVIPYNF